MAHSYTVLVVERTDFVRRVTTRTLAESGCQVLEAASADEALALLERPDTQVDLVLIGAVGSVALSSRALRSCRPSSGPAAYIGLTPASRTRSP